MTSKKTDAPKGRPSVLGGTPKGIVPKRTRQTKYDWVEARLLFIEGIPDKDNKLERTFLNLKELSEHLQIPYEQVRGRSSRERWMEQRTNAQVKLSQERMRERNKKLIAEGTEFDERALGVAKVGLGLIQNRLAEIAKEIPEAQKRREQAKEMLELGVKVPREMLYSAVNYREMDGLASAAARFQEIGRKALGTDVEKVELSGSLEVEQTVSVTEELLRDDPERLTALLAAASKAGLLEDGLEEEFGDEAQDIIDGEIVEDDEEGEEEG